MADVSRPKGRRWGGGRYIAKRKPCPFCSDRNKTIDHREPLKLRPFISDRGKIAPRRKTGVCAKHQRTLAVAIKRARHLALLPYVPVHIRQTGGIGVHS